MRETGNVVVVLALLLAVTACSGSSGSDSSGGGSSSTGVTPDAVAAGAPSPAEPAEQGQTFTKATPDQSFCDIFTEQDTAALNMVTHGRPQAGQNQVAADQPTSFFCTWQYGTVAYNDVVGITAHPSEDRAKQSMALKTHGITAGDVVPGADESDYRAGTGDEVKAIVRARFGKFIFSVSLNDTIAKLSPDDAQQAAVGLATLMTQRCPNIR